MTPRDDIENVKRVIQESYSFEEALRKLGLTMASYHWIRHMAKEHNVKTKPEEN
jgi:hypothetical protein